MMQLADSGAPFPTIDAALAAGHRHMRSVCAHAGAWPVGMVAEEQPGGYFVRISWCIAHQHGRRARKQRVQRAAEIGRIEVRDERT